MQILSHNYQQLILLFLIAQVFGISFAIFAYKDLYIITFLIAFYLIFFCINYKRNSLTENIKIYFLNIIFIGFLCGVFATTFKIYKNQTAPLNGEYLIKGRVLEIKPRQGEMVLTVEVDFINTFSSKPINKILVSTDAKITNNFMIGTNIIFSAKLKNFEYNWFLNQNRNNLQYLINGISGSGKMLNLYLIEEKTLGFLGFIYKIRKKIYDTLVNNIGSNGHFVAALILGETGKIDSNVINAARSTGVSHILCVSGLHLSIVCFLFFKV
ncbi:MAG: ComEC/Rec2 family competence protein, partial [Rickettsiales bacterium]